VLINDYTIIGRGFNTVVKDSDITGHAEINAINDAIHNIGFDAFMSLNRDNLIVISTLEPCEMCSGTLKHYNIKYIQFIKEKSLSSSLGKLKKEFLFQLNKKQAAGKSFLDSLKSLHPDYVN
jgi:tRNA(Arg) A34 adenosine deaminase TadA